MSTLEVNKITPAGSGTTVTLGDSGDSIDITSGATVTNFKSTGIDDNATSTALTISSDGRTTLDATNEKPLVVHHTDGSEVKLGFSNNAGSASYMSLDNSDFTFNQVGSEKMRIQSNGRITTFGQSTTNGALNLLGEAGASSKAIVFAHVGNGAEVGSITTGASSTAYNTSSDYRLKENVVEITDATTRLKQLQPKRFNFIADADTKVDGFLAHEVSDIVPEAISGTKDEIDADGNPVYQGIDQSKLVPLLTASLKEAIAKIETLETEMTALKARVTTLENA